jgi:tetratricopeptide (TPR) repeat protein
MRGRMIILLALALVLMQTATAVPSIPTEFYGTATIYNVNSTPLGPGTRVEAYADSVKCGTFFIQNGGYYGVLSCLGDDEYTNVTEGAVHGQNILFRINNRSTLTTGDTVWYYGEYHRVDLNPMPQCPNGYCELTETCVTCAEDCGLCPRNYTGNSTGTGSNETGGGDDGGAGGGTGVDVGGGSGADDGGGSTAGGGSADGGSGGTGGAGRQNVSMWVCQEDWRCTEWQPEICPMSEVQNRTCVDYNFCHTYNNLPILNQSCIYEGTCTDIVKNQDETDVDCGGLVCEPCDLFERCLIDFDCKSGFCNPIDGICMEPTCIDGFKNQGEERVDCGGPCPPCESPTLERPETVIRFISRGCGPFPWLFLVVASIASLIAYGLGRLYLKHKEDDPKFRKLRKLDQLIRHYNLKRDLNIFVFMVTMIEISIALYLHYFCELGFFFAVLGLVVFPTVAAAVLKTYVYDEKRKKQKLRKLILGHEDSIKVLINIEETEIRKDEQKVYDALTSMDYSKMDKDLALSLKDIRFLLKELLSSKTRYDFELQNSLADSITVLDDHKELIDADESLKDIYVTLKLAEKIHRDIILQYKYLKEEEDLEKDIEKLGTDDEEDEDKDDPFDIADHNEVPEIEEVNDGPAQVDTKDVKLEVKKEENKGVELENKELKQALKQPTGPKPAKRLDYKLIAKEYAEAKDKESYLNEMLKGYPNDAYLHLLLAIDLHRTNSIARAEEEYKRVLTLDQNNKQALYYLASIYNQQKRYKDSMDLYERIIKIDPAFMNTKSNLSILKAKLAPMKAPMKAGIKEKV